jgi:4-hydroxy-tetrahydrodipicolinate reductase
MGREIERIALERGHTIVCIIDIDNRHDFDSEAFRSAHVAIEFSRPDAALDNYRKCFHAGVPIVSGTTGWLEHLGEIKQACLNGQTFFYASNFSLGVNLFFALNKRLAEMMNGFPVYEPQLKEIHHTQKMDAPSGTAITLAEDIIDRLDRKQRWVGHETENPDELYIKSERTGVVPGYHEIVYDSSVDTITISHNAKSRVGFALGAVLAAEFTATHKGFLGMNDLLGF